MKKVSFADNVNFEKRSPRCDSCKKRVISPFTLLECEKCFGSFCICCWAGDTVKVCLICYELERRIDDIRGILYTPISTSTDQRSENNVSNTLYFPSILNNELIFSYLNLSLYLE